MEMKFSGEFHIELPKQEVYNLLLNPAKFVPLFPTYESLEMKDERTALVRVKVGVGIIRGTAATVLTLVETDAPHSASYLGKGNIMQGAYQIAVSFNLNTTGKNTLVIWQADTLLVGKILSLAGGGLRGYAAKEINHLITSLQIALSPDKAKLVREKGWLARFFQSSKETTETTTTLGSEVIEQTDLAPYPEETRELQSEAINKINTLLAVKRTKIRLWRKEDERLIRGHGLYVDDYQPGRLLHMILVRSPYAHAKIANIDVSQAENLPGVVCTLTGKELTGISKPFMQIGPEPSARIEDYCLAVDKVRYQGDPVVAVIAESKHIASDAAQLVQVDYDTLPVLIDIEDSMKDDVLLHEQTGTNQTWQGIYEYGDVEDAFARAKHIVKIDHLKFHRFSSTPLETNAVVATWDKRGELDILCNTILAIPIAMIAPALDISTDHIRLRTHDIGGGFGNKNGNYPYITLAALASRKAGGAPVKWIETRSEHMQAGGHGGERNFFDTEIALDENGVMIALRSRHVDDCGAYPRYEPLGCVIWSQVLPASYKIRNFHIDFSQVMTNKSPCAPNRGYSRTPHLWFMDRVLDICSYQLDIPADEIRRRNYIDEFPYTTPNGCVYDSGDFATMLNKGQALIAWDEWKEKQAQAREEGRLIGLGIGTSIDSGTNTFSQAQIINPALPFSGNSQVATIKLDLDGTVSVALGSFPQGQSHETTTAQVVAGELGIDTEFVNVKTGFDTERNTVTGTCGTYASQFAVTGLSAAYGAVTKLKSQMKKLAAYSLEANEDDLEFGAGEQGPELHVVGTDKSINYWALANLVNYNTAGLPEELRELSLNVRHVYVAPFKPLDLKNKYGNLTLTYAIQMHFAVVEVDKETGKTSILDYAIVDDCGTVINHMIVEGQTHGAAAHGIGAVILENMPYDEDGNVLCGSFTDYVPITIINMPDIKGTNLQSPSPFSYNGAKGMGEGGGTPMHTIAAALQNALREQNVIINNSHNSRMSLYETIHKRNQTTVIHETR